MTRQAAVAAAAAAGASAVSKMNVRAVFTRCSRRSSEPSTAPPWEPSALDSVAVSTTCSAPARPVAWTAPRPPPATPIPCASSTTSSASCSAHSAAVRGQVGGVAEDRVDRLDDHHRARLRPTAEQPRERVQIAVRADLNRRFRQPGGVDQRGVDVGVGDRAACRGCRARSPRRGWRCSRWRTPGTPAARSTAPARARARAWAAVVPVTTREARAPVPNRPVASIAASRRRSSPARPR